LAEPSAKSPAAVALIEQMIAMTTAASELEKNEREAVANALRNLRQQSVSAACRGLVKAYCGELAAKDFAHAYGVRSKMLHTGELPSGSDLAAKSLELEALVRRLLSRHIADGKRS